MTAPPPPDSEDRLAYAVSLMQGAAAIAATAHGQTGRRHILPFFLLICFALENGLKAYLEYRGVDKQQKIDRPPLAHDLNRLCKLATTAGLNLHANSIKLIDSLRDSHLEHHFRYPKKAGTVEVYSDEFAYVWTEQMLAAVAAGINYQPS